MLSTLARLNRSLITTMTSRGCSSSEAVKQLRALNSQVEKLREETRSFLETKDRQFGELQQNIQLICSGLVSDSATPLGAARTASTSNGFSGMKRSSEDFLNDALDAVETKKRKEEKPELKQKLGGGRFSVTEDGFTEVYTDGACPNNGKSGARAGVGVWWGDSHPLNYSARVTGDKQTNNAAEIQAATVSIKQGVDQGLSKLLIHTDSQFLISCITQWVKGWKSKGWKTATGQPVKNKEDLMELDNLILRNKGLNIKWNHVKGHSNIRGNEEADRLAVAGSKQ